MNDAPLLDTRTSLDIIDGWFWSTDRAAFRWFLERQQRQGVTGDLVELGAYLGKSAVVIGDYLAPGETFTIVDLFESEPPDDANATEMDWSYSTLTRKGFEANYLQFHHELPRVYTAPTSQVMEFVEPGTARFIHVDASHLYEHVILDVDSAKAMQAPGGIVVFDDYRSEHTPGVAAAVWEAIFNKGFNPIVLSETKLYGTWDEDVEGVKAELFTWLDEQENAYGEYLTTGAHQIVRAKVWDPKPKAKAKPRGAGPKKAPPPPPPTGVRKVARDWLPPRVYAAVRDARARRRG